MESLDLVTKFESAKLESTNLMLPNTKSVEKRVGLRPNCVLCDSYKVTRKNICMRVLKSILCIPNVFTSGIVTENPEALKYIGCCDKCFSSFPLSRFWPTFTLNTSM